MFFLHPVCLGISLVSGFTYSCLLKGKRAIKTNFMYILPMGLLMALINPAFNHAGVTIITHLPSGNPLTLESIIYGLCAGAMIGSVVCHFSCYNEVMTSDKFMYLFGKVIPAMSLIISMTLRFVPRFSAQLKVVTGAQRCMGRDISKGSILQRARNGLNILSIMTTWALENAVETAYSMKSRGYGLPGRTAFSIFSFDRRDRKTLFTILFLGVYIIVGYFMGQIEFIYFPSIQSAEFSVYGLSVFLAYLALCICPIIIELWEVRKWNALK